MRKRFLCALLAALLALGAFSSPALALERGSAAQRFAQRIPIETVRARLAGGTDYLDKFGVTRKKLVAELSAHEHDSFYLGTPFVGGDWQSPRGDTSYNGQPGTNCAGFVAYVLRKCGLDVKKTLQTMRSGRFTNWSSGLFADGLSSASNYMSLAEKGNLVAYAYPNKAALLAGGKCEKGDIILRFWTDSWGGYDEDNHLMIFWGANSHEDKVWQNASGRLHIGQMWSGDASSFIVIKFAPEKPPSPPVAGFQDVFEADWYAGAVAYVKEAGLMEGVGGGEFRPKETMTRAQLVTTLWRLSGSPEAELSEQFADVADSAWYAQAIAWAVMSGVAEGRDEQTFDPSAPVSRQEFAAFLYRYCQSRWIDTSPWDPLEGFRDVSEIADYALPAIQWAKAAGVMAGTGPDTLEPRARATRAQAATLLQNLREKIIPGTPQA